MSSAGGISSNPISGVGISGGDDDALVRATNSGGSLPAPALRKDVLRRAKLEADRREREEARARAFREALENAAAEAAARAMEARLRAQRVAEEREKFRRSLLSRPTQTHPDIEERAQRRSARMTAPVRAPRPSPRSLSAMMAGIPALWEA